jgi:hypothetical protein
VSLLRAYLHEPMLATGWALGKFRDPAGIARLCDPETGFYVAQSSNPP